MGEQEDLLRRIAKEQEHQSFLMENHFELPPIEYQPHIETEAERLEREGEEKSDFFLNLAFLPLYIGLAVLAIWLVYKIFSCVV